MQIFIYFYVIKWPEDDHVLVENMLHCNLI